MQNQGQLKNSKDKVFLTQRLEEYNRQSSELNKMFEQKKKTNVSSSNYENLNNLKDNEKVLLMKRLEEYNKQSEDINKMFEHNKNNNTNLFNVRTNEIINLNNEYHEKIKDSNDILKTVKNEYKNNNKKAIEEEQKFDSLMEYLSPMEKK